MYCTTCEEIVYWSDSFDSFYCPFCRQYDDFEDLEEENDK